MIEEIEDGGLAQKKANVLTAQAMDAKLKKAESKQSGKKNEIFLADMDKQSRRERNNERLSVAPDVEYSVPEGVQGFEKRRDQGVLDWDKQQVCT